MRFGMGTRRAALDALGQVMDATSLEDLFSGDDGDAIFMFDLLSEVARGRGAACYWEVCRTARRRGVSPEYVADRAAVLLASIEERRRTDVYRILGIAPLASGEAIRHRWLEFAKAAHPDTGGDVAQFRQVKDAYEMLRDPERRGEYERYWRKALGPFDRVAPRGDDEVSVPPVHAESQRRVVMVGKRPAPEALAAGNGSPRPADTPAPPADDGVADPIATEASPRAPEASPSQAAAAAEGDVGTLMAGVRRLLSGVELAEIERLRAEIDREVARLEIVHRQLGDVARVKRIVPH